MSETMNTEQLIFERIQRVRSADWLSLSDLCLHCGFEETAMRELVRRPDFPMPSAPTGSVKGRRWPKQKVNEWMLAHTLETVSDA